MSLNLNWGSTSLSNFSTQKKMPQYIDIPWSYWEGGNTPKLKPQLDRDTVEIGNPVDPKKDPIGYVENSKYLSQFVDLVKKMNPWQNRIENPLKNVPSERLPEFEEVAKNILDKTKPYYDGDDLEKEKKFYYLNGLINIYLSHPETYDYVMNSSYTEDRFNAIFFATGIDKCASRLSLEIFKEMEKSIDDKYKEGDAIWQYVENSDKALQDPELAKQLHDVVTTRTTDASFQTTRALRHTGIFKDIELPDSMTKNIKTINKLLKHFTTKSKISGYSKNYMDSEIGKINLYDYIKDSEKLSLADAMQMMKYLPSHMRKQVLNMIKGVKITDERYKSTTFNDEFVEDWLKNTSFQTTIKHNINVPKGSHGYYIKGGGLNQQHEFLIADGKKEFEFVDAQYDSKNDRFILESNMYNV